MKFNYKLKIKLLLIILFVIVFLILSEIKKNNENYKNNNKLGINYDFIEVGTSNFDTEIQKADDNTIGLSVEPLKIYLDDLPNKKKCKKINKAVSNKRDKLYIYYIKPEDIDKHKLPGYLKGCNSIINPHPLQKEELQNINRMDLMQKKLIDVITFEDLVKSNNVNKIKLLKIDTEGHDPVILDSVINYCDKYKHTYPDKIIFETNQWSNADVQNEIITKFKNRNYKLIKKEHDAVLEKIKN